MPRPVFGDPKTDFVFQRIFGSEEHKLALIGLLDDILELDDARAGLRTGILDLCEVLGLPLTPAELAELDALDADALTRLRDQIKRERRFR